MVLDLKGSGSCEASSLLYRHTEAKKCNHRRNDPESYVILDILLMSETIVCMSSIRFSAQEYPVMLRQPLRR